MKLTRLLNISILVLGLLLPATVWSHVGPEVNNRPNNSTSDTRIDFRSNCANATEQKDMEINNVRARLTTGGDVWWDGNDGRYVVPKPPTGVDEVSSIFAGAVWLGGRSPSGELKVAAQQYGRASNPSAFDYYPGPLTPDGTIQRDTCAKWDRFWTVSGASIIEFLGQVADAEAAGTMPLDPASIPADILGWPSTGNPYFFEINDFDLPTGTQGLAGFWDNDLDGIYDPTQGDYPVIEVRGCPDPQFADEMTFWIYNDAGNNHNESNTPTQLRMEVQVQAFAYSSSDELNNMTFQRYKLINRAQEDLIDTYFAMWVDPDLGCFTDDYVGCDTTRSLAYVYNEDPLDGTNGCTCDQGVTTYCDEVPILGVDYFRGPLAPVFDENGNQVGIEELGMSSFIYINNAGVGNPPAGTTDPNTREEYYNYLQGIWRDGRPLEIGGDGYDESTEPTRYALPDAPDDGTGWSMCTSDLGNGDRRTVQASGPFTLQPGAVNELIIGVPWVPNQDYPCPSLQRIQQADDIAQNLFDACFDILDGPDAPDLDWIEMDREVIVLLSNARSSNNFEEAYEEVDPNIPSGISDSTYVFEGYRIFQFSGPDVGIDDLDDPDKVRIVAEYDKRNSITRLFNWEGLSPEEGQTPTNEPYFVPESQVDGNDQGIRHSLSITQDAFGSEDTRLINHRRYYFTAIAYAYNNYKDFDPTDDVNPGQRRTYLPSRRNIGDGDFNFYTVIPRPIVDLNVNAQYGDMPAVTRLAGKGNGGNFLEMTEESRGDIVEAYRSGTVDYEGPIDYIVGGGPINIQVVNPLEVVDGDYEINFIDEDLSDDEYEGPVTWTLQRTDAASDPIVSEKPISEINEQLIAEYGFSVNIADVQEPGLELTERNGAIGGAISYADPNGSQWLTLIPDGLPLGFGTIVDNNLFNYVNTDFGEQFEELDPNGDLTNMFPGVAPYKLMDWNEIPEFPFFFSPVWRNTFNNIPNRQIDLEDLNNVDLVFTSDKSLWTRCPVVETRSDIFPLPPVIDDRFQSDGEPIMFDPRSAPSVTREADADGRPTIDTEIDPALGRGMGWFPGYAIDVETGQRLQVFWGENSVFDGREVTGDGFTLQDNGADMIFNPSSTLIDAIPGTPFNALNFPLGGHHYVYVTNRPYDEGEFLESRFEDRNASTPSRKSNGVRSITYAMMPLLTTDEQLLPYADGLIPNDVTVKIRVNSQYDYAPGDPTFNGHGAYRFTIDGSMAGQLDEAGINLAMDQINVVPNPYYGGSFYEGGAFDKVVKITNLPARCEVTIFSLDGKFIRKYDRDEQPTTVPRGATRPVGTRQIAPALEWDLNNFRGIPVASGVYLIHVNAFEKGERTLKFFGINRQFDPSGL
ncbi:MAG: hypothetical protein AAF828_02965 [Bacteroidota bacterium]